MVDTRWTMASGSVALGSFEDGTVGSRSHRHPPRKGVWMEDLEETSNWMQLLEMILVDGDWNMTFIFPSIGNSNPH